MKYGAFLAALSKPPLKQVFLLTGAESFYIEKAKNKILSMIEGNKSLTVFENTLNLSYIMAAMNAPSLFSEKVTVLIKDAAIFKSDSKAKDKELEKFIDMLLRMESESYIIFILNDIPDKRRKIYKAVEKIGLILESKPLKPWEINEWLSDKLMSIDKSLDKDANLFFMNMISVMKEINLSYLDKEFDKLALYTKEKRIDKKTMEEVFSAVPEVSSFALIDAINEKNLKKAIILLKREIETGRFFPLIIGLIAKHLRELFQVKILMKEGKKGRASLHLGLNPFIAEKLSKSAAAFDEVTLSNALILLSDADYLIKTGQGGNELLEEILVLLCKDKKRV